MVPLTMTVQGLTMTGQELTMTGQGLTVAIRGDPSDEVSLEVQTRVVWTPDKRRKRSRVSAGQSG